MSLLDLLGNTVGLSGYFNSPFCFFWFIIVQGLSMLLQVKLLHDDMKRPVSIISAYSTKGSAQLPVKQHTAFTFKFWYS
jgi:hypothetical protein